MPGKQAAVPVAVAAADLGASSGRVIVGQVAAGHGTAELQLHEVHRFPNIPVMAGGTLHWDILRLYAETLAGLGIADREFALASAGIDSWGVDFGLLDSSGALLGNPVHYRDARTDGAADRVLARIPATELYAATGIQQLPFNTIYQLAAAAGTPQLQAARTLLLIPDLLAYWLTGNAGAEVTNASTTQLLEVRTRSWATSLMDRAGIPQHLFPQLRQPGDVIGELATDTTIAAGMPARHASLPLIAVGSHDTASAVAGIPAAGTDFAYISCGTWALVGVELDQPVLTEASRRANFTNEAGIDGTIRYLRNVMGLWLLQESIRTWADAGMAADQGTLLRKAALAPQLRAVVDPNDPAFLPPGDMPSRIARACEQTGQPAPQNPPETVRCILDSLALAFRRAVLELQALTGRQIDTVHIVGGGARNPLLCQLTADACRLPVVAGPVEAAALGNILVQARTLGAAPASLDGIRSLAHATQRQRRFKPAASSTRAWETAARRVAIAEVAQ
jgi:rhamnulokinase